MSDKKFDSVKYRNQFEREHYDRLTILVPKGKKEVIKKAAADSGMSMSELIMDALSAKGIKVK